MYDVLIDALLDSLKLLPFLFAVYVILELIESRHKNEYNLNGRWAPVVGAGAGLLPQCGFSVMATNMYSAGRISVGTLIAVYLATSDEAIPVLLAHPDKIADLAVLLAVKFVFASCVGLATDAIFKNVKSGGKSAICGCEGEREENMSKLGRFVLHPALHSLKIFAFILIVNVLLGTAIFYIGEENLESLARVRTLQPLLAAVIGLIPNCASSVLITELYANGALSWGALAAGLSVNAGVGTVVLFRVNRDTRQNFAIVGGTFAAAVTLGFVSDLIISLFR